MGRKKSLAVEVYVELLGCCEKCIVPYCSTLFQGVGR